MIALLLATMTLLTFVQVVLRYVFNSGLSWALEATSYMFGWLIFIGIAYGVKVGSHIGVDVVVKRFGPTGQRIIGLLAVVLALLYAGLMFYGGYIYVDKMHILGVEAEDIPIPRWILLLIVPVGMAAMFIRVLQSGWAILRGDAAGLKLADEAGDMIEQFRATEEAPEQKR
ncbi:MAG: TRAP transporter small permease [Rhodospirillales bacterium]